MKNPNIMYILIGVFCVLAILAGIYAQFIDKDYGGLDLSAEDQNTVTEQDKSQVEIKDEFDKIFTNTLNLGNFDTTGIPKINGDNDIVYTVYEKLEMTDNYEVNIHIPIINIKSDLATKLNNTTQTIFVDKANNVLQNTDPSNKSIYSIDYSAYVNGNILSVVIRSTLKESKSAQRIIIQTYNYNLATKQSIELSDIIGPYGLTEDEINAQIKEVTQEASAQEEVLASAGYETYKRDLENPIYQIENIHTFFLGANGELYIIFAYGNNYYTSEMDIIKMNTYPEIGNSTNNTQTQNSNEVVNNVNEQNTDQ